MLQGRRKISHKELKKDKLVTTYFQARDWLDNAENRKKIGIYALVIVAILVFGFIYISNKKSKNEEAMAKLLAVENLYEQGNYQAAIDGDPQTGITGLNEIVANYGSTQAGEEAKFFLANSLFFVKDYDNALKYYEDYSGDAALIKASCLSGIGAIYEAKGDMKKAAEYYEKAFKHNKEVVLNAENMYYAIRAYTQLGDKESAGKIFKELKTDYPTSKYFNEAKRYEPEFKN